MTEEETAAVNALAEELSGGRRTPREAAEERLHGWLERGWPNARFPKAREPWSGARNPVGPLPWPEIVCILAGLDPETSASADARGWALLPGALATYGGFVVRPHDRHGLQILHTCAEERIQRLCGLGLQTMSAKNAIKAAVAANLPPPWLAAYLGSDHAMQLIPALLRADLRASIESEPEEPGKPGKPKTVVDLASAGGRAKGGEQRAKFFPTVERLWKEGLTGAAIIKRLQEEHDPAPAQSTVYDWIEKLKRAKTG